MSLNLVVDFELELSYLISSPLKTRRENPQKPQAPLNEISYFWSRVDHICICVFGAPLRSLRRIQLRGEFLGSRYVSLQVSWFLILRLLPFLLLIFPVSIVVRLACMIWFPGELPVK